MDYNRQQRERNYVWYFALKDGRPCTDCGGVFHPVAMQWDHRPGAAKLGDVATLQRGRRSLLLAEIAKCDLVCANCHAVRTYIRRRNPGVEPAYPDREPR
jgi:hypothetical protein